MILEWFHYPLIITGGFIAGFINTLAGSGSLITLPLLITLGLPVNLANGTNRVAILLQNVVASTRFRREGVFDLKGALWLGIPASLGAFAGAQIAVSLDEFVLRWTIGAIMVVMFFVVLIRPNRWLKGRLQEMEGQASWVHLLLFFLIGVYGGFIQAGVGIFLLIGLVLGVGYDLVRANAVKVGIVLLFTLAALAVFILNQQVDWVVGLILAIGNMLGAWFAARAAVERGTVWVHRVLVLVVAAAALHMFGLF